MMSMIQSSILDNIDPLALSKPKKKSKDMWDQLLRNYKNIKKERDLLDKKTDTALCCKNKVADEICCT